MKHIKDKGELRLITKALISAGSLEGVIATHGEDEIGILGGHLDKYLLVTYLGQLIERGELEISIAPERVPYLQKLLHM